MKTIFHEMGHSASRIANPDREKREQLENGKLRKLYERAEKAKETGDTAGLQELKKEIDKQHIQITQLNAAEEAVAESAAHQGMAQTDIGKKQIERLKTFSAAGLDPTSSEVRSVSFTATGYYHTRSDTENYKNPFAPYLRDLGPEGRYTTLFGADAAEKTKAIANATGAGVIMRSN